VSVSGKRLKSGLGKKTENGPPSPKKPNPVAVSKSPGGEGRALAACCGIRNWRGPRERGTGMKKKVKKKKSLWGGGGRAKRPQKLEHYWSEEKLQGGGPLKRKNLDVAERVW